MPSFVPVPDLLGWPHYDGYIYPYFYPEAGIPYTGAEVYPPAAYLPSPDVYAPAPELPPSTDGQPAQPVWYYCRDPMGYYPYVRDCNGQWQPVPASVLPPPQPEAQ